MITKFNIWFDSLREPKRFLYFIGWMVTMIALMVVPYIPCSVIGSIMLLITMAVGISRL